MIYITLDATKPARQLDADVIANHHPSVRRRAAIELKVVRRLVAQAKRAGFTEIEIDDGGEAREPCADANAVVASAFSVDDSRVYFRKPGEKAHWVRLVMGNDGYDVISDYSYSEGDLDGWRTMMEERIEKWIDKRELEGWR